MGSGSYLGGSTVVGGGWAWSGKSGLSRPKKKKETHEDMDKQFKRKLSKLSTVELNFLNNAIDSELNNTVIKKNKKTIFTLALKIEKKGGIGKWAKSHALYQELKLRKIKRKAKKFPNKSLTGLEMTK